MKKIKVGNLVLGEGRAKICVPVMGANYDEIVTQTKHVVALQPDVVEWRCDFLDDIDLDEVVRIIGKIRELIGQIPLIFTFRTDAEGGNRHISDRDYVELNLTAAATKKVDFVDVEAYSKGHLANVLISDIHNNNTLVIASNHDFYKTPSVAIIESILVTMEKYNPDICKIAVMPKEKNDVNILIEASRSAYDKLSVPIISMSMGEYGSVTRVCTKLTKSCLTFAAGAQASAPGQISCDKLKELMDLADNVDRSNNIVLIGFMGTGKSTVSSALSKITGMNEVDVDKYIVEQQKRTIAQIFEEEGEQGFRTIETEALREIQKSKGQIISCGGGAVLKDENVNILKDGGIIVLLTASPEIVFDRVKDNTDRPLLNKDMSIEHIKKLMEQRRECYEAAADIKTDTNHSDRVKTCYHILKSVSMFEK
ncbi:MAG: type I 3-dehydroquinate dehydratase [Lachnospiraceae bacterium]|nr:type I 3-dehydroquinate dehydratase [Lachnospiraceae bacterium]